MNLPEEDPSKPSRRQELERHLRLRPSDRDAFLELATIYRGENHPLHAIKTLQDALSIFPDDHAILWELEEAKLARSLQQISEVRDLAQRVGSVAVENELSRAGAEWANCRIRVCRARLARDPSKHQMRVVMGEAFYELGQTDDAIETLTPLADDPTHAPAANLLMGRCHQSGGRDVEAMRCFRAASIRRATIGPPKIRIIALRSLCELAQRHGLSATLDYYQGWLQSILKEQEATA